VRHSPAAQILAFGERQKVAFFNSIGKRCDAQLKKTQCNKIAVQQSSRADLQPQLIGIGARRRDCVPNTLAERSRLALFLLVRWLRCDPSNALD
jgi:hypothetical protein